VVSVRYALVTAVLVAVAPALAQTSADSDAELRRIQAALAVIQQTQQGVYQQFQMVQELRRAELGRPDPFAPQANVGIAPPPRDYAELQRERETRETRIKEYTAELERLYVRYQELEEEKRPLLERLGELARGR
jgi:predicted  nucleic acid-binding Zn-ribbon protein